MEIPIFDSVFVDNGIKQVLDPENWRFCKSLNLEESGHNLFLPIKP